MALSTSLLGDKNLLVLIPRYTKKDVLFLEELIEAGSYRAVIDRSYPLDDVVQATRYVERAEDRKLVPTISRNGAGATTEGERDQIRSRLCGFVVRRRGQESAN